MTSGARKKGGSVGIRQGSRKIQGIEGDEEKKTGKGARGGNKQDETEPNKYNGRFLKRRGRI